MKRCTFTNFQIERSQMCIRDRGQTVAEIATATGVPEKEVRKLEAAALRVLRHPRVSQVLREYR